MSVMAGLWQQNTTGFWYQIRDHIKSTLWGDDNGDGTFDGNGYLLNKTTTPDGYQLNADLHRRKEADDRLDVAWDAVITIQHPRLHRLKA